MKMERLATLAAFLILAVAARKNVAPSEDRKNACTGAVPSQLSRPVALQ
jgi:hypothetical protein